jgi:hypothetical protein
MSGGVYEIRFPNGALEVGASTAHPPPEIGDILRRRGMLWKVVGRTRDEPFVVRVEPAYERRKVARS